MVHKRCILFFDSPGIKLTNELSFTCIVNTASFVKILSLFQTKDLYSCISAFVFLLNIYILHHTRENRLFDGILTVNMKLSVNDVKPVGHRGESEFHCSLIPR